MSIRLHLLNSKRRLDPLLERIESAFSQGVAKISEKMPASDIDVVVSAGHWVIPELGLTGESPSDGTIFITIDPTNINLLKDFEGEFLGTLGHELHHCMRHGGPGFGATLGEALVSEGLACHFEAELREGAIPFYARVLDDEALKSYWERAQRELTASSYDHKAWFFGSPAGNIPMHTGYSLGFHIVDLYIKRHGIPASQLWSESAASFF